MSHHPAGQGDNGSMGLENLWVHQRSRGLPLERVEAGRPARAVRPAALSPVQTEALEMRRSFGSTQSLAPRPQGKKAPVWLQIQNVLRKGLAGGVGGIMLGAGLVLPAAAQERTPTTPLATVSQPFQPQVYVGCAPEYALERSAPNEIEHTPLFDLFWRRLDGLARCGVDEVTDAGADILIQWARTHHADGSVKPEGAIDREVTHQMTAILSSTGMMGGVTREYGRFVEDSARAKIYQAFGINQGTIEAAEAAAAFQRAATKLPAVRYPVVPDVKAYYAHMSDDKMIEAMGYIDQILIAQGRTPAAVAYEKSPVLGWAMGLTSGHYNPGVLTEKKPLATSGLPLLEAVFRGDAEVKGLPVTKGFEMPKTDLIDGFRYLIRIQSSDKITFRHDDTGETLRPVKVLERDAAGQAISVSFTLVDAKGNDVPFERATGVVLNGTRVKGDAHADSTYNMGFFGFCNKVTAALMIKSTFALPELDRDVPYQVNGQTIVIPKDVAQRMIDVALEDLVPYDNVGWRFNGEPQTLVLKNGQTMKVRLIDTTLHPEAGVRWLESNHILLTNGAGHRFAGLLEYRQEGRSDTSVLDVKKIDTITQEADGTVTIKMKPVGTGAGVSYSGTLITNVPWNAAVTEDGKQVLHQTDDYLIDGVIKYRPEYGREQTIPASQIQSITGESMNSLSITRYMAWIDRHNGVFATSSALGPTISNGMRYVNEIEKFETRGKERPEWAGTDELKGLYGPLVRQTGDKIQWVRGLYATKQGEEPTHVQFSGWVQLNSRGQMINEGFISGESAFGWAPSARHLDWSRSGSFHYNPAMTPEMELRIFINGISDEAKLEALAAAGNLPSNWRDYRSDASPAPVSP